MEIQFFYLFAGCYWDSSIKMYENVECSYWTSTAYDEYICSLWGKPFGNSSLSGAYRQCGLSIRPVTSDLNDSGEEIDHSQDHLVTDKISCLHWRFYCCYQWYVSKWKPV